MSNKTKDQIDDLYQTVHSVISKTLTLEMTIHDERLEKWQHRDVPGVMDRPVFPQQTVQPPQGFQRTLYQPSQQTAIINDIKNRATELMALIAAFDNSITPLACQQSMAAFPLPPQPQDHSAWEDARKWAPQEELNKLTK